MSRRRSRQQAAHSAVYHRAAWQCQMPECLCPSGRKIDRELRGTDGPWSPSIDHVKPLGLGGQDQMRNMRAAHKECNRAAAQAQFQVPAPRALPPLTSSIGDRFPGLAERLGL